MLISISNAVVDENAVVVHFCYAMLADTAVFRARGLEEMTCMAGLAGMEDREVVRVEGHSLAVILRCDITRITCR
jgi:hypothetical protein